MLQKIRSKEHHVGVIWAYCDEMFGVVERATLVANLLAGFHNRSVDGRLSRRIGMAIQIFFEISRNRGAVVARRCHSAL
jgi:hypothetical protein